MIPALLAAGFFGAGFGLAAGAEESSLSESLSIGAFFGAAFLAAGFLAGGASLLLSSLEESKTAAAGFFAADGAVRACGRARWVVGCAICLRTGALLLLSLSLSLPAAAFFGAAFLAAGFLTGALSLLSSLLSKVPTGFAPTLGAGFPVGFARAL